PSRAPRRPGEAQEAGRPAAIRPTPGEALEKREVLSSFQSIQLLQLSPDGQHLAFAAQGKQGWNVIEDGKVVGGTYQAINEIQFTPDGKQLVFIAQTPQGDQVLKDGKVGGGTYQTALYLQFSPDGQHFVFVASVNNGVSQEVIEDGRVVGGLHEEIR